MSGRSGQGGRDEAWFEAFFRAHHAAVRAYALRRVGADDADDVVVDVFATAWACRDQLPDEARPWLYRCAWHRVAARQRADARRARLIARVAAQPGGVSGGGGGGPVGHAGLAGVAGVAFGGGLAGAGGGELAWVNDVLDALPPDEEELLRLAAWEGLAPREIAGVLGCTPGAARVRLHRARRKAEALCPPGVRRAGSSASGTLRAVRHPAPQPAPETAPETERSKP